eukprot:GHVU01174600.1.p1 GENE.GHVU01174600.1~~GHVU01174600.1.p1  ORF type:complete len:330 (+),score=15.16 GHVU01174600.1:37-990(+)
MRSNNKIFELILEQHSMPQNSYLDQAVMFVCLDECKERKIKRFGQLLEKGWRLDTPSQIIKETPLVALIKAKIDFSFIFQNFYEKIEGKRLLSMDAHVFGKLVMFGHDNVVKHIINHEDFKPNFSDDLYAYYITCSIESNRFDIACELLKKCPDAAIKTQMLFKCMSASSHVKIQDYKNIILVLQARHVNINESPSFPQEAPIHRAISSLNISCLQALLECHADTSILNYDGLNLLQFTTSLLQEDSEYKFKFKSDDHFGLFIKILSILKDYLGESKFDEQSGCQMTARCNIWESKKRNGNFTSIKHEILHRNPSRG